MVRAAFLMDRLMAQRRPVGPRLHPAAVELRLRDSRHHGDAHDRGSQGPADDDPDRAADDLLGAAAGLYARSSARSFPTAVVRPGVGLQGLVLFALYRRWASSARCSSRWCCAGRSTKGAAARLHDGDAQISDAAPARPRDRPVAARVDLPAPRRHDHLRGDDRALGAAHLSQAARGQPGPTASIRSPGGSPRRSRSWSSRSASTTTSRWR